jgi:hypothetical protein
MEKGFYHQTIGYWQTTSTPSQSVLNSYPEGTIEVPLKPGINYKWNGSSWEEFEIEPPSYSEEEIQQMRLVDYQKESDPLFFKWQAGESTKEEWENKRQEIKNRY